ncbi:hypothetical protein EHEL_041200 [Encephalitozoon hellem ATCC 50504]|uniref:Uncharacterized protein n=1 Tax=Encephalitozoon hellem TaxID=27973 RepID=A0A9Q9C2R4_ENCHE|nr:uncharacterized protein EHEL_041200 [Encephalitozoon hellem ATCC 50504]AFM98170.1 hypothetical protein EHEL_041200 [Encephalitozoon hellem ATCC 50504]UTX43016.1 hypothetical protein GPU96_04g07490 [Encephalitozoon hellem]|eukprot:XP_003887151.1 hypothetical protein EHEL_041200 [Encephalitozoon hellem ATCC 50504]
MESVSGCPMRFESLKVFFEIVRNERHFKIQIITLESLDTFEAALKAEKIAYAKYFSSMIGKSESLSIILKDSDIYLPNPGRYVLFNNMRHREFVQVVFIPTLEEKLAIVGNRYIVEAYKHKNISELLKIAGEKETEIESHFGSGMDYFESVIMLAVRSKSKFKEILACSKEIDEKLGNSFFLQMKLNGLVHKQFVVRNGDSYRVNVSKAVLRHIGRRVGLDADSVV